MPKLSKNEISSPIGRLIDTSLIKLPPNGQPRRSFNDEKLKQLTTSIKVYGVLEPLIIRTLDNNIYELVAGERRLRAAKAAGLTQVPVIIKDFTDDQALEIALLENLQRDDLNPIDETEGILRLLQQNLSCSKEEIIQLLNQAANCKRRGHDLPEKTTVKLNVIDEIFLKVGRLNRESFRTNRLPLLNLPEDILRVLRQGELTYTKAKAIANLKVEERQKLIQEAIDENLSLSKIKERVQKLNSKAQENQELARQETIDTRSQDITSHKQINAKTKEKQNILFQRLIEIAELAGTQSLDILEDMEKQKELECLLLRMQEILENR